VYVGLPFCLRYKILKKRLDDIMKRWQAVHGMDVRPNIRFVGKNSIIVPGLSGAFFISQYDEVLKIFPDSHAHILEYGASLVIPLNRARDPSGQNHD
jgi:hypothetical protein